MAWNPSPEVAVARDFGKKFNYDKVYIIGVNELKGTFEIVSYGGTKQKCGESKVCSNQIYEMIRDGLIKKEPCKLCGDIKSEAHHNDYTKPLKVIWFCRIHHMAFHKELKAKIVAGKTEPEKIGKVK